MQRLALAVAVLIVTILFIAQSFTPTYTVTTAEEMAMSDIYGQDSGIETALTEIYFNVNVMGLKNATAQTLTDDFGLDSSIFSAVYGKYTDGRFGIADVIIVQPKYGQNDAAIDALQAVKLFRINTFGNFDVYNSTEIAKNGVVFQRGDYLILMMIDDQDDARAILEKNIQR